MRHSSALRTSLLVAMGIVPIACGGTTRGGPDDGDSGSGSSDAGSRNSTGGTVGQAGTGTGGSVGKAGTSSSAGAGTGGSKLGPPTCTSPKLDALTGQVTCAEGYHHRPQPVLCQGFGGAPVNEAIAGAGNDAAPLRPRAPNNAPCGDTGAGGASGEELCSQYELGFCSFNGDVQLCESGCIADEDCGTNGLCECGHAESPSGGVCVPSADCKTDGDCPSGFFCASYGAACSYGGYACLSLEDQCRGPANCGGGYCSYEPDSEHRVCGNAVCGRPFLVEHAARVAQPVTSRDWSASDGSTPRVDHLTPAECSVLAAHWTRLGQLEHASIAAFARFNLQLLSLGAPPELVEACTAALADETAHTKLCFAIASVYAGHPVGPGPLDVSRSLEVSSLEDIVDLVIAEGCFGETGAALEALEAAETAADPVIRNAYARIARDEQRHAELAFRFVRWALQLEGAAVKTRIAAALAAPLHHAGALSVAVPCLRALLAASELQEPSSTGASLGESSCMISSAST